MEEDEENNTTSSLAVKKNDNGTTALSAMRGLKRAFRNEEVYDKLVVLEKYIQEGVFNRLTKNINALQRDINRLTNDGSKVIDHKEKIFPIIEKLYDRYHLSDKKVEKNQDFGDPIIVTSETFE